MAPEHQKYDLPHVPATLIEAADIDKTFSKTTVDLVSSTLQGTVLSFSDQWFAEASNLINPKPPIHIPGKVVYTGGWYDGWETRRHNKAEFDYVVIKTGLRGGGYVEGVEIDTTFFNGNEAPAISVEGYCAPTDADAASIDAEVVGWKAGRGKWETVLGLQPCGPNRRQAWKLASPTEKAYTHIRLNQYPDGGISRFRLYGRVAPPRGVTEELELAAAMNGGRSVLASDEHFSSTNNLLLPGRGVDMAEGWETRRSRTPGHTDWVIVRLGLKGKLSRVVVDTAHFRGNYPQACKVEAIDWNSEGEPPEVHGDWKDLTGIQECSADKEHVYEVSGQEVYSHVKMTIIPDGGVKRLRAFGIPVY